MTLFPFCFAVVVGHTAQKVAQLQLEHGAPVRILQQWMGSTTVFSAVATQLTLRSFNLLGLGLLCVWALSPVGAQAALRMLSVSFRTTSSSPLLAYLNVTATSHLLPAASWSYPNTAADQMFIASLVTTTRTEQSSTDLWGNVKIPILGNQTMWMQSAGQGDPVYSTLIGLPVLGLPDNGNTTATVTTPYLSFNCSGLSKIPWRNDSSPDASQALTYLNGSSVEATVFWLSSNYDGGFINGDYTAATCSVVSVPVEASMSCSRTSDITSGQGDCTITSAMVKDGAEESRLLPGVFHNADSFNNFARSIQNAMPEILAHLPTVMDIFMADSSASYTSLGTANITLAELDPAVFSHRLTQMVNSFYMARLGYQFVAQASLSAPSINITGSSAARSSHIIQYQSNLAQFTVVRGRGLERGSILRCSVNWAWFVFFLLATLVLIASSVVTSLVKARVRGPEILGFISTLTRDNPNFAFSKIPSTLTGWDRARLLRDVSIRFGDVAGKDRDLGSLDIGLTSSTTRSRPDREYL